LYFIKEKDLCIVEGDDDFEVLRGGTQLVHGKWVSG
jgi:hypothetical protein